MASRN